MYHVLFFQKNNSRLNNHPDSDINILTYSLYLSPSFLLTLLRIGSRHHKSLALNTTAPAFSSITTGHYHTEEK